MAAALGCTPFSGEVGVSDDPELEDEYAALKGANLSGTNLAGTNLAGSNLAGTNLAGANMGGNNLSGTNLAGSNLGGTNLGGNNLGGSNLAGSNLAGTNLAGSNLAGSNLAGSNLAGSNLAGSNLSGTNRRATTWRAPTWRARTWRAATPAGTSTTSTGSINGLLYSAEDMWSPKTGQCVVMGIGSTAFAKLLGPADRQHQDLGCARQAALGFRQQLGRVPGPARLGGGGLGRQDLLRVRPGRPPSTATWSGVAGFIKAVFRWNAPPTQSMEISGIEASAPHDSSLSTTIATYTGMMNAAARWRAGTIPSTAFMAGELAFVSATTNNQSVIVDFSSWVQDNNKNALVLGNVQVVDSPTYAEALYIALDNGDGTVQHHPRRRRLARQDDACRG